MKLHVLGCGDAFGSGGRNNSGFLVEAKIDQHVYSLYGLTREEIAIIEESLQERKANRETTDVPTDEAKELTD